MAAPSPAAFAARVKAAMEDDAAMLRARGTLQSLLAERSALPTKLDELCRGGVLDFAFVALVQLNLAAAERAGQRVNVQVFGQSGTCLEAVTTAASHVDVFVLRMDIGFHQ